MKMTVSSTKYFNGSFLEACRQAFYFHPEWADFMVVSVSPMQTNFFLTTYTKCCEIGLRGQWMGSDYETLTLSLEDYTEQIKTPHETFDKPGSFLSFKSLAIYNAGTTAFTWNEEKI